MDTQPQPFLARMRQRRVFWFGISATVVGDIVAKSIASHFLKPVDWNLGEPSPEYPFIEGVVNWTWAIGSIVPDEAGLAAKAGPIIYSLLFWGVILYFVAFKRGQRHILTQLGGALTFGGIAGNLADLIIFGGVRNFMLLAFDNPLWSPATERTNAMFSQHPSFSTAALALWIGVLLLIVGGLVERRKSKSPPSPPPPTPKPRGDSTRPYGYQQKA